jgi:hypothetical protein
MARSIPFHCIGRTTEADQEDLESLLTRKIGPTEQFPVAL